MPVESELAGLDGVMRITGSLVVAAALGLAVAACSAAEPTDGELHAPPQDRGLLVSAEGCQPTTYEAEQMFHSTGGATTGGWNLWSSGYISTDHGFAAGPATITVTARGSVAAGVWPHMRVSIGGTEIGSTYVTTTGWSSYPFNATATAATQELRITYDNDLVSDSEDRNLMVDKVVIACPTGTCEGSTAFAISTPLSLDRPSVQAWQDLTGTVTYANCSSAAVSILEMRIAGRRPGATHTSGPFDDFTPFQGATSIAAGTLLTLTSSRRFTASDPAGSWVSYATYEDAAGAWHDGPEVGFTVDATPTDGGGGTPYPSGWRSGASTAPAWSTATTGTGGLDRPITSYRRTARSRASLPISRPRG